MNVLRTGMNMSISHVFIYVYGTDIPVVDESKLLGLMFDKKNPNFYSLLEIFEGLMP